MPERSGTPWRITLIGCVAVTVVLLVGANAAGGYANPPWFLAVGVALGVSLACLWVLSGRLLSWTWSSAERMPRPASRPGDHAVERLAARLADPVQAPGAAGPILRRALAARLDQTYGLSPDHDHEAVRAILPDDLAAVLLEHRDPAPDQLPRLLAELTELGRPERTNPTEGTR